MELLRHIKKKTVNHIKLSKETLEKIDELVPLQKQPLQEVLNNLKFKDVKDKHAFLIMEDGVLLRTFFYNDNGRPVKIPLANPVLIYFHTAQSNLRQIYLTRKDLLGRFQQKEDLTENSLRLFYDFFGLTSSFITLLMTAIEAFVNQNIKDDTTYEKTENGKFTKHYDSDQIQRWIPLEEKIEKILNRQKNKDFAKKYPLKFVHINNLKNLRDSIVHTKSGDTFENYTEVFKQTLNFKFSETIEAVKDFINFYDDCLIEQCSCGGDF